jgi:hypothetical protein
MHGNRNRESVLNRTDLDGILGPVTKKTKNKQTNLTNTERNMADVVAFYESHGRLPTKEQSDSEDTIYYKLAGIAKVVQSNSTIKHNVSILDRHDILAKFSEENLQINNAQCEMPPEPSNQDEDNKIAPVIEIYDQSDLEDNRLEALIKSHAELVLSFRADLKLPVSTLKENLNIISSEEAMKGNIDTWYTDLETIVESTVRLKQAFNESFKNLETNFSLLKSVYISSQKKPEAENHQETKPASSEKVNTENNDSSTSQEKTTLSEPTKMEVVIPNEPMFLNIDTNHKDWPDNRAVTYISTLLDILNKVHKNSGLKIDCFIKQVIGKKDRPGNMELNSCSNAELEALYQFHIIQDSQPSDKESPMEGQELPKSLAEILEKNNLDEILGRPDEDLLGGERAQRSHQRKLAGDVEGRVACESFDQYKSLFDVYKEQLESGKLVVSESRTNDIAAGDIFLWDGFIAIITGESIKGDIKKHSGKRTHVVFSNGTEAWLREGSIVRAMYADSVKNKISCKRVVKASQGILGDSSEGIDTNNLSGYLYVARTKSKSLAFEQAKKSMIKIGVTSNKVSTRISRAERDPTFLCAPVDIVATYELYNMEIFQVEKLLHTFFGGARLEIQAKDKGGDNVTVREWFAVDPKHVSEAFNFLMKGQLDKYRFNAKSGSFDLLTNTQ